MKFSEGEFSLDKSYAMSLIHKKDLFRQVTETKKMLFTTLITTYGAKENAQYFSSVDAQLTMDALFSK